LRNNRYQISISIVVILLAITILGVGNAPPIMPSSFYGMVLVDGAYVSDGTIISAWIDGNKYAEVGTFTFEAKSVFTVDVPADNPETVEKDGGEEGDGIIFKIGSDTADQTGTWHSGTNMEINLTASTIPSAPTAGFSGSPISGDAPLVVNFVDSSIGSFSSWLWDFGDSGSSTAQNPSHEYTTPGNYTIALTVAGPGGSDTETKVDYITVTETLHAPNANFSATPTSGDAPLTVEFTDLSSGSITSRSWSFGDGGSSTTVNPSHEYTSPGTYTVVLSVAGPAGSDSETKVDYIKVAEPGNLIADFTANPVSGVVPLKVSFIESSSGDMTSWFWTFGDGGSSTDPNPTYVYASPGTFSVSLKVSNSEGFDIEQKVDYIIVSEISPDSHVVYLPLIHP
jgi:PKD repeat protein